MPTHALAGQPVPDRHELRREAGQCLCTLYFRALPYLPGQGSGMVLHARASAKVTQDNYPDRSCSRAFSGHLVNGSNLVRATGTSPQSQPLAGLCRSPQRLGSAAFPRLSSLAFAGVATEAESSCERRLSIPSVRKALTDTLLMAASLHSFQIGFCFREI